MKKLTDDPMLFRNITFPLESVRVVAQSGAIIETKIIYDEESSVFHGTIRELIQKSFPTVVTSSDLTDLKAVHSIVARASQTVRDRSRRAFGNVVVVSENTRVNISILAHEVTHEILYTDALEDNEMVVMYRSDNFDGPFIADIKENGTVDAILSESRKSILGNCSYYGIFYDFF